MSATAQERRAPCATAQRPAGAAADARYELEQQARDDANRAAQERDSLRLLHHALEDAPEKGREPLLCADLRPYRQLLLLAKAGTLRPLQERWKSADGEGTRSRDLNQRALLLAASVQAAAQPGAGPRLAEWGTQQLAALGRLARLLSEVLEHQAALDAAWAAVQRRFDERTTTIPSPTSIPNPHAR